MERSGQRRISAYIPVNTALLRLFAQQNDDLFQLDGEVVEMVVLVGLVESVTQMSMRVELILSDEWGLADAVGYKKNGRPAQGLAGYDMNRKGYAGILGSIRRFALKLTVVIVRIYAIERYGEVVNHRLAVIWSHYKRIKGFNSTLRAKKQANRFELSPVESAILQKLKNRKPPNRLSERGKSAFAKEMGIRVIELETHISKLVAGGYLTSGLCTELVIS